MLFRSHGIPPPCAQFQRLLPSSLIQPFQAPKSAASQRVCSGRVPPVSFALHVRLVQPCAQPSHRPAYALALASWLPLRLAAAQRFRAVSLVPCRSPFRSRPLTRRSTSLPSVAGRCAMKLRRSAPLTGWRLGDGPTLMRNSSQKAGCMRLSPASHCCQVRQVVCNSAAAAVWDSPNHSRNARTSAGCGFAEGPRGPRFGWFGITSVARCPAQSPAA